MHYAMASAVLHPFPAGAALHQDALCLLSSPWLPCFPLFLLGQSWEIDGEKIDGQAEDPPEDNCLVLFVPLLLMAILPRASSALTERNPGP